MAKIFASAREGGFAEEVFFINETTEFCEAIRAMRFEYDPELGKHHGARHVAACFMSGKSKPL